MCANLKGWYLYRIIYLIVFLIIMSVYFVFRGLFVILGIGDSMLLQWNFLAISILLSLFAFFNYLITRRDGTDYWSRYALFLLIAMLFGTLGDFLLAGVLPILVDTFIFGVLAFALGQAVYLLALRQLSQLIIGSPQSPSQPEKTSRISIRNLLIWLGFIIGCIAGFMLFLFNPALLELSIGGLCYFLLFSSVLAFALTKFFDNFKPLFQVSLFIGFLLFYISDIVLVWNRFNSPVLYGSLIISITYLLGQLLVQLSPLLESTGQQ